MRSTQDEPAAVTRRATLHPFGAKLGGMEDRIEVCGTGGVVYADLFMGNPALTYSERGYGFAMEKAGATQGWTFTNFEEASNQGYPQELKHFIDCVRHDTPPLTTGEEPSRPRDGERGVRLRPFKPQGALPFRPTVSRPIDLWLR